MNILILIVGILFLLLLAILAGFGLVEFFKSRLAKPKNIVPKKTTSFFSTKYWEDKKWLKWFAAAVIIGLIILFMGPVMWSKLGVVAGQVGLIELLLVLGVIGMIATLLSPDIRGDRRWSISYAIVIGVWLLTWAYVKQGDYRAGLTFTDHLRMPGLVALWILIPACAVAIYLVKHWGIRILVLIPALWILMGLVGTDFKTSPKTAELAVLRGATPSAQVRPYDTVEARWEWTMSYTTFDERTLRPSQSVTNELAIVRNDDKFMSMAEKLPDGRIRFYEWVKNERYGNWREDSPLRQGRWRAERRDTRPYHYYDAVIIFDAIARNSQAIIIGK